MVLQVIIPCSVPYLEIKRLKPGVIPSLDDISNDISSLEGVDKEQVSEVSGAHLSGGLTYGVRPQRGSAKSSQR